MLINTETDCQLTLTLVALFSKNTPGTKKTQKNNVRLKYNKVSSATHFKHSYTKFPVKHLHCNLFCFNLILIKNFNKFKEILINLIL